MQSKVIHHEFPPYYDKDSKVLILGSIPSVKSRIAGFYYMHPQNKFWQVLAYIYQEDLPLEIEDKKCFLKRHHIALWDVLESCEISGSSDSTIKNPKVNDILSLINKTNIKRIYVTGKKALSLYQKYCYPKVGIEAIYLPSTSPANASCSYEKLKDSYMQIRSDEVE